MRSSTSDVLVRLVPHRAALARAGARAAAPRRVRRGHAGRGAPAQGDARRRSTARSRRGAPEHESALMSGSRSCKSLRGGVNRAAMRGRLLGVIATFGVLVAVIVVYFIFILEEAPPGVAATVHGTTAQLTLQTDGAYGHAPVPGLGQLPGAGLAAATGSTRRSSRCPRTRSSRSRSTSTTPRPGCATRSSPRCAARSAASAEINGTADERTSTRTSPRTRSRSRTSDSTCRCRASTSNAKNQCSVAPCTLAEAHNTITFTLHDAGAGHLPLAVLRPLRARLPLRQRRADADDRLHGRHDRGRVSEPRRTSPDASPAAARRRASHGMGDR